MPKKKSKKATQQTKVYKGIIIAVAIIAVLAIVIISSILFGNAKPLSLKDLKTSFSSLTLNISYNNDCASDVEYKIDFKTHDTFGVIDNATTDEYNCKRYFLGSENKTYQKYYAANWESYDFEREYPDSRVTKVLEIIKKSQGEVLSENKDEVVFGVANLDDAKTVYAEVNNLSAFGNDWGASNFQSISAKVFLRRNGVVNKIIFFPVSKQKETSWGLYAINSRLMILTKQSYILEKTTADFDSIRNCKEITWSFSNINDTTVNSKEDLWNI